MSGTLAQVVLVGRLTRDAELKYTNSGTALCTFTVATDHRAKKGDQWVDEASFWTVNLWGKRGESVNQYLTKGKLVSLTGAIYEERWEQDGQKRSRVKVDTQEVVLLGSREEGHSEARGGQDDAGHGRGGSDARAATWQEREERAKAAREGQKTPGAKYDDFTDDIPF